MSETDYNELLYEKVRAEYDAFIEELKQMKPEQIIDRAYEKVTKENMVTIIPDEWKQKEPKEIRAELSKIRTAMNEIHSRVSEELYRQKQERSKEQAR